jgi:tRNA threonylcarbamoyladenosine biosynthesis protein TsaB
MRTLAIECATEACSVALFEDGTLLAGECRVLGRGHAEALVPMIAALPGKGKAQRIAVGLGPGSFTGLRVALAAARALQLAWRCELVGFPTLALVAAMAQARGAEHVTVCMTGGHGEWFVQDFGPGVAAAGELASLTPQQAAKQRGYSHIAGSKAAELAASRGDPQIVTLDLLPDAREFLLLPAHVLTGTIVPLYGRAPDARLPAGAA